MTANPRVDLDNIDVDAALAGMNRKQRQAYKALRRKGMSVKDAMVAVARSLRR